MNSNKSIYLDSIVFSIQKFGGASTYWKELLMRFVELDNVNIVIQGSNTQSLNNDAQIVLSAAKAKGINVVTENILPASILRYLPFTKKLPAGALYHNSYYRTCFQNDVVNIFTVHDFTHKRGLASRFPRKMIHIGLTAMGLKNADGIICISENTKRDLLHFYPSIAPDKVRVIYHGVGDEFYPVADKVVGDFKGLFNLKDKYALFVGKRGGYKKFDIIPEAVRQIPGLKLVVVGGGPLSAPEIELLEATLPGRYIKVEGIDNAELNTLYNSAHCLLYPSQYEGFGIPVIEAMKAGCPVITNSMSSLGEVAGDAALVMTEITTADVLKQLEHLGQANVRADVIRAGFIQSSKFTWQRCFEQTYQFYQDIYSRKTSKQ